MEFEPKIKEQIQDGNESEAERILQDFGWRWFWFGFGCGITVTLLVGLWLK